jgi:hypothetical protein
VNADRSSLRRWCVELFAAGNLAFLALDIWFAHSINGFHDPAEWIPFVFSLLGALLLVPGVVTRAPHRGRARRLGWLVGGASVLVGVSGLFWHLQGTFFREQSLHNLVYTAPLAAPLAYTGLGFLLILNRTESARTLAYGQWVLLLAAGGFAGNFVLSLADHAQNGFFRPSEWIAVVAAAFGFTFLGTALCWPRNRRQLTACGWVLAVQVVVGLIGSGLHLQAIWNGPSSRWLDNAIHTAPLFAPLLFVDLALLGGLGLWCCGAAPREPSEAAATS